MNYLEKSTFASQKWKTFSRLSNHHNETALPELSRGVLGTSKGEAHGSNQNIGQSMTSGQEENDIPTRLCVTQKRSQGSWHDLVSLTQGLTWKREKIRNRREFTEGKLSHR